MTVKLLHITVHFEYADAIEALLERHAVTDYVSHPNLAGRDAFGTHRGTQVFPGHFSALHAQVPEERIEAIFQALEAFRQAKPAHQHLQALVLPIERRL